MSKNAFIDLIARLNKNKSKSQIKEDLKVISGELNGLKDNGLNIQCHIDTSSEAVNKLQGELNTLANKLKLNIGVDAKSIASTVASKTQSDNSATTSTVKIDKMSAQSQVEELGKLLRSNLKGEADAVLKGLLEETKNTLGQTTEIWTTWERNAEGALKSFSISAKQATGDLQKFNYAIEEGGKVNLLGSSGSDKGILQKQKETLKFIDEYTSKINSLRSSSNSNFTTVYNGETVGFKSLLDDLEKLRNGEGSVEDIRAKFVALQGTIDSIKVTVKESQGKSLNPFTNANITAKEFDNTLKSVKVDLDNLKGFKTNNDSVPTVKELNKEYKDLSKAISTLNQVEESQRGNQWYLDFASASERVRQLQSDIKLLNKLKREDTSSGTKKQTEELLKITHAYRELQKLEERRFSGKAGNTEINQINSLEGGYRRIINTAQDRLKKQELLTSEVKKTIAEEEKALNIARNLAKAKLQDKSITQENARIEKEQNNKRSQYMSEITQAYARQKSEYAKLYSPKSSEEERRLAQERIDWNDKIITHNRELLDAENLLTQKNQEKLKQLQDINEQKQKEAQAGANRVIQSQAETERLSQEKKEAKDLADTITQIVNGYEKLATLYSGKTAPTNGTAKSDINKAESARQHSELQAQLSELTEIANANDKITKQQQEQIANAKTQYEQSVKRTNQYNQQIINEQNQIQADRESTELAKQQRKVRQDILGDIKLAYSRMNAEYSKLYNPKLSQDERNLAQQRIEWNQKIIDLNNGLLQSENLITQKNQTKLDQLKEINEQKQKEAQASANRVTTAQAETQRLSQEKKEAKDLADTITQIVNGYEKLATLYSGKTAPTNGTAKSDINKAESARQHSELQAQLSELTEIANANDKITKQQQEQIANAKTQYEQSVKRTNQYNQQIINEQNQIQADRESTELAKQQRKVRQDILGDIKLAYDQMNKLNGIISNSRTGEKERQDAERQYAIAKQTAVSKEEELRLYALSCEYSSRLTQEEEKKLQKYKELNQNQESLNKKHRADIQQSQLDNAKYEEKKRLIKEITDLYSKSMIKTNQTLFNSSPDSESYQIAKNRLSIEEAQLKTKIELLNKNHELTGQEESQIISAREKYQLELKGLTAKANDTEATNKQKQEYDDIVKKVKQYTDILSKFNNSRQVKQNTGFAIGDDPNKRITVSQQIKDNDILLKQLNDISNILSQGKDPKVLKDAQAELNKIIGELDVAKKNSQEFTNTLTNNKIARDAERNLNTIRNQINKFGNFNPKAIRSTQPFSNTSTYADEYRRIQDMANDASLAGNADKVNELTTAFKNFEQKARAAGLTSNKFFVDMGSQLKMVLNRYISLYAVIGYIRKMVENVKNLDEAMINLRRVTDETESGYVAFLEKANKQASELKVTTSELVQQTYQWSKLGYELDDALTLSKASTIFSKVADITEEQSLKNLITILKAYGIEAKNVMDVVDKLDNINNKYAVDAAGLGNGLERSASALAMTGNSLEQSIAMLTGAGEITQNLENTGNAMKVVSLR